MAEMSESERRSTARLFDVRRVIGGLFVVYGVIVTVVGLFDSEADLAKAQGVRINLWTGLAMLTLGLLFLLWLRLRPLELGPLEPADDVEPREEPGGEPRGEPGQSA
jgi:hypothetical protein